ncbi:MAG: DUF4358 domain-containing protein [Clostridia bacterium]|nr:DUF4358 domain-containing protein [Clostridia bacterium]
MTKQTLRPLALILSLLFLLTVFTACGGEPVPKQEKEVPFDEVFAGVSAFMKDPDKLVDAPASYLSGYFKTTADTFANSRIQIQSVSTVIDEIGLFEAKSDEEVAAVEALVDAFFAFRKEIWDDQYLPEETPKLEGATRVTHGRYVLYVIADAETVRTVCDAFEALFR